MNVKFLLLVVLLTISAQVMAKAYRWVDEDGETHYSDAPPPQVSDKVQEIKIDLPPPQPVSTKSGSKSTSGTVTSNGDAGQQDTELDKAELAERCSKTVQLFPKAMFKARAMIKERYKKGEISRAEMEETDDQIKAAKAPSQSQCEADYKTDKKVQDVVDCFANADGDPEMGLFCVAFVKAMDEAVSDIKAKAEK